MPLNRGYIHDIEIDYLHTQLLSDNAVKIKRALQTLTWHYRHGLTIPRHRIQIFELTISGLIHHGDAKVLRWSLNALALLGATDVSANAIHNAILLHKDRSDCLAAGIAALYKRNPSANRIISGYGFDDQLVTLAALQNVPSNKLNLRCFPINIENASPEILKLSIVLIGLGKSPPNIFGLTPENWVIRALGGHDDTIVSQYTAWAIVENNALKIEDLGINIKNIETHPSNVRSWVMRLLASRSTKPYLHHDHFERGARDPDPHARNGLAVGIGDIFYDDLAPIVFDWYGFEDDLDIRGLLLNHIIKFGLRYPGYQNIVTDEYWKAPEGSPMRAKIEITARGTDMMAIIRQNNPQSIFDLGGPMTNRSPMIFNGPVNAPGAVFGEGTVTNQGNTSVSSNAPITLYQQAIPTLIKARDTLEAMTLEGEAETARTETLSNITDAEKEPSQDKLGKVISSLQKISTLGDVAYSAGHSLGTLIEGIKTLLPN